MQLICAINRNSLNDYLKIFHIEYLLSEDVLLVNVEDINISGPYDKILHKIS